MHTRPPPPPAADDLDAPRLVLRDGTVASVRAPPARRSRGDAAVLSRAVARVATASVLHRGRSAGRAGRSAAAIRPIRASADAASPSPASATTTRHRSPSARISRSPSVAEVAFAVDDRFQGKGIATLLLERLARDRRRPRLPPLPGDDARREHGDARSVSRLGLRGPIEVRRPACVDVQLSLTPRPKASRRPNTRDRLATAASLRPMLEPRAVAVVGASRDPASIGRRILDALVAAGFHGPIYPVNPHADEIAGLRALSRPRATFPPGVDLGDRRGAARRASSASSTTAPPPA